MSVEFASMVRVSLVVYRVEFSGDFFGVVMRVPIRVRRNLRRK